MNGFPELPHCESLTVEFKSQWDKSKVAKTLVAFANTVGGDLYIGIDDKGNPIGVDKPGEIIESIAHLLHDAIFPSMMDCVSTEVLSVSKLSIVKVHVECGRLRPYCLNPNDARSVYVRLQNTSAPATLDNLREIIRSNNPLPFESRVSEEQNLTFNALNAICEDNEFRLNPKRNVQYGLWDAKTNCYTNLAFILSEQSTFSAVLVSYADDEKLIVKEGKRVAGSVFTLLKEILAFISETNTAAWEFPEDGSLQRKEIYYVQPLVLREAIVNAIAHRDYSRTTPISVHVSPSFVEIFTVGGLADLDAEEVMMGMATNCRNPKLATILGKLRLMEGIGNGFRQFRNAYKNMPFSELLEIGPRYFKICLPRISPSPSKADTQTKKILDFIAGNGLVSRAQIQKAFSMSPSAAVKRLHDLRLKDFVISEGKGPSTRYRIKRTN